MSESMFLYDRSIGRRTTQQRPQTCASTWTCEDIHDLGCYEAQELPEAGGTTGLVQTTDDDSSVVFWPYDHHTGRYGGQITILPLPAEEFPAPASMLRRLGRKMIVVGPEGHMRLLTLDIEAWTSTVLAGTVYMPSTVLPEGWQGHIKPGIIRDCRVNPNGSDFALAGARSLLVFDTDGMMKFGRRRTGRSEFLAVDWLTEHVLISATRRGRLHLWDMRTQTGTARLLSNGAVESVRAIDENRLLVAGMAKGVSQNPPSKSLIQERRPCASSKGHHS